MVSVAQLVRAPGYVRDAQTARVRASAAHIFQIFHKFPIFSSFFLSFTLTMLSRLQVMELLSCCLLSFAVAMDSLSAGMIVFFSSQKCENI